MSLRIDAISKYSGSKARFAHKIVDQILRYDDGSRKILDICAGSGAVTLELRRRGVSPRRLVMVEIAHYGAVFDLMSKGKFSLKRMRRELEALPQDKSVVQEYLEDLSYKPVSEDRLLYRFLLFQSVALRALQIEYRNGQWSNASFDVDRHIKGNGYTRDDYTFVAPDAERILYKVGKYAKELLGVTVYNQDALSVDYSAYADAIVYVDPPYKNTAGYHYTLGLSELLERLPESCVVLVSEARPLSDNAVRVYRRHNRDEYVSRLR